MYKVFIVDDEPLVISSIKATLNWSDYGFTVIGEAYNGIEAYEKITLYRPDVVFVDIRMPGMSGLELIKKVNDLNLNIQFIVISGYAEFAYAQKAMNNGALGYCLKPFDDVEIGQMLIKAKKTVEKKMKIIESDISTLLYEESPEMLKKLQTMLESLGIQCTSEKVLSVIVSVGTEKLVFSDETKYIGIKTGSSKYVYFLNKPEGIDILEIVKRSANSKVKGIGIGNSVHLIKNIHESIEKADIASYQFFISCKNSIRVFSEYENEDCEAINRLEKAVNGRNVSAVYKIVDEIEVGFLKGVYNIKHAFNLYNSIISFLNRIDDGYSEDFIYNYNELLQLFHQVGDMLAYLKDLLRVNLDSTPVYSVSEVKNCNFKSILHYVNKTYCSNISLQELSLKFFMSSSYISQLFKKETGQTFTQYLTSLRVSYACELLKTTNFSIAEISEKSGYSDYFYFTRIFKKVVRKTPSQFRECNE